MSICVQVELDHSAGLDEEQAAWFFSQKHMLNVPRALPVAQAKANPAAAL